MRREEPIVDLERELAFAVALARDARCAAAVDALNLRIDRPGWGVGFARIIGDFYEPSIADGAPALIFAAEECGDVVDLVACRLGDRAAASRLGIAAALGADAIETARHEGRRLLLYGDALRWAHGGFHGACIVDWTRTPSLLAEVDDIACSTAQLASRVHSALSVPVHMPKLSFARRAA